MPSIFGYCRSFIISWAVWPRSFLYSRCSTQQSERDLLCHSSRRRDSVPARVLAERVVRLPFALVRRSAEGRGTIDPSGRPLVHFNPAAANMTALLHDPCPLLWLFSSRYRLKIELDTDRSLGKRSHIGRRGGNLVDQRGHFVKSNGEIFENVTSFLVRLDAEHPRFCCFDAHFGAVDRFSVQAFHIHLDTAGLKLGRLGALSSGAAWTANPMCASLCERAQPSSEKKCTRQERTEES